MKYIDEFRDIKLVRKVSAKIKEVMPQHKINIMEVCGTHTMSFFRFGLDELIPPNLKLIAGPGCPVCVSPQEYIDNAIKLAQDKNNIILTFGDMLRVPGNETTLEKERVKYGNVKTVYSPLDALSFARSNPRKKIIFLAVGFETTAPGIALTLARAKKEKIKNLVFYSSLKLITPAMEYLVQDKRLQIAGFLCPGHVSCIIGTKSYEFIPQKYKIGCCITGFEPLDILEGLYFLIQQIVDKKPRVQNQYMRAVTRGGNVKAKNIIFDVFRAKNSSWRGLGIIPKSGLKLRDGFARFDAEKIFSISHKPKAISQKLKKCRCGDVLKGLIFPKDCPLFSKNCNPDHPIGPCMVSSEGACNAYYKYR
jgi:hydrogenase expression/formation protein HypD